VAETTTLLALTKHHKPTLSRFSQGRSILVPTTFPLSSEKSRHLSRNDNTTYPDSLNLLPVRFWLGYCDPTVRDTYPLLLFSRTERDLVKNLLECWRHGLFLGLKNCSSIFIWDVGTDDMCIHTYIHIFAGILLHDPLTDLVTGRQRLHLRRWRVFVLLHLKTPGSR
jgi:hypothetical protein